MNVEQIPANELVTMTDFWHKAFNAVGCNPQCHCCGKMISTNILFKLSTVTANKHEVWGNGLELQKGILEGTLKADAKTVKGYLDFDIRPEYKEHDKNKLAEHVNEVTPETKEVMLCETCTPALFLEKEIQWIDKAIAERDKPKGGCFRVNGKIVV